MSVMLSLMSILTAPDVVKLSVTLAVMHFATCDCEGKLSSPFALLVTDVACVLVY